MGKKLKRLRNDREACDIVLRAAAAEKRLNAPGDTLHFGLLIVDETRRVERATSRFRSGDLAERFRQLVQEAHKQHLFVVVDAAAVAIRLVPAADTVCGADPSELGEVISVDSSNSR